MRYLLSTRSFSFLLIKHYFQRKHPNVEKEMCKSTSRLSETQNQCSHNTYHFFEAFEKESSWQIIRFYLWLPMGHCSSSSNPFQNPPFAYLRTYQLSSIPPDLGGAPLSCCHNCCQVAQCYNPIKKDCSNFTSYFEEQLYLFFREFSVNDGKLVLF